jgi:hypothetical protein
MLKKSQLKAKQWVAKAIAFYEQAGSNDRFGGALKF